MYIACQKAFLLLNQQLTTVNNDTAVSNSGKGREKMQKYDYSHESNCYSLVMCRELTPFGNHAMCR